MRTIGLPRGLYHYYDGPLWEAFFSELGFEVLVSQPTNRSVFERGLRIAYSELCLPVKVFIGHVASLAERVDCLFIPRLIRVEQGERFTCPKFIGLPDLVKASFSRLPPIVSVSIDLKKRSMSRLLGDLGRRLGVKRGRVQRATRAACEQLGERMKSPGHREEDGGNGLTIGVVGHPYIVGDRYLSMDLVGHLHRLGARVLIPEVEDAVIDNILRPLAEISWSYERRLVGELGWLSHDVDGAILALSFGCGPGSVIAEIAQRELLSGRRYPLLTLVLDENTSATALITRLESFCDMVRMQKR